MTIFKAFYTLDYVWMKVDVIKKTTKVEGERPNKVAIL
ncbi:hypothetical protein J2S10_004528 [Neobacillus ginsengisoli]|uniref:Uncharacterized protein n=1 Tax=Neobacillus ginsengisoli TaxID=904295 RepID=A0ABT9Y0G4_9BACI|nr:hypothetical protein [Neobacillus ginsengisoli]